MICKCTLLSAESDMYIIICIKVFFECVNGLVKARCDLVCIESI